MQFHDIANSSQIAAIAWENDTLQVRFHSGSTYEYQNVRKSLFQEMLNATKPSNVFNSKIKNHQDLYPYKKLD